MPRPFDVTVASPATVAQVHGAFGDADYWLARFAAFATTTALDSLVVEDDGTVVVSTTQDLRHSGLPRPVAAFYPGDLKICSTETWRPDGHRVHGGVTVDVVGAPGSGTGAGVLEPLGEGSQLTFSGQVVFKVPVVGGRIESYLAGQFARQLHAFQRFTTDWITGQA